MLNKQARSIVYAVVYFWLGRIFDTGGKESTNERVCWTKKPIDANCYNIVS